MEHVHLTGERHHSGITVIALNVHRKCGHGLVEATLTDIGRHQTPPCHGQPRFQLQGLGQQRLGLHIGPQPQLRHAGQFKRTEILRGEGHEFLRVFLCRLEIIFGVCQHRLQIQGLRLAGRRLCQPLQGFGGGLGLALEK